METNAVYVIAPGGYNIDYNERISKFIELLSKENIDVIVPKDLVNGDCHPYYSNDVNTRVKHIEEALKNPKVKLIWCYRGGSGSSELIELLSKSDVVKDFCESSRGSYSKILIGFSDITFLHIFFNQRLGQISIHGSMVGDIKTTENNIKSILSIFRSVPQKTELIPINKFAQNLNEAIQTKICGGNLTILSQSIGTNYQVNANEKILILEDVEERGYQIKRALVHLWDSKIIQEVKALLFAEFTKSDGNEWLFIKEFIAEYIKETIPCFRVQNVGHSNNNIPIIFNCEAQIVNNMIEFKL